MEVKKMSRGERFLAAFNDIEDQFRRVLDPERNARFLEMAGAYTDQYHLPPAQRDGLRTFADLRNTISHGRWHNGQPIAEPNEALVREIEQLRDQIISPPKVVSLLQQGQVCTASPEDPVKTVLKHFMDFDYSQIPVYDGGCCKGILTTNAVARWAAFRLRRGSGLSGAEPVSDVLGFRESHERVLFTGPDITVAKAIDQLIHGGEGRTPVTALLVTDDGLESGAPVGIITGSDLPTLSAALGIVAS